MTPPSSIAAAAINELRTSRCGEIQDDRLSRALYATDASIYEIIPDGVILPRSVEDVQAAVRACVRHGVPITARGAGTGLAGGAVNRGLQLDCSRHLNRILRIDPDARTAHVEPGVVLDELNAALAAHGLHFAPDVATSSRATIGGMISNNSCGAHSVLYGRTVDHVLAVDVVLADGSRQTWGEIENGELRMMKGKAPARAADFSILNSTFLIHRSDRGARCESVLRQVASEFASEIASRYPRVMRRNAGYALDRLRAKGERINVETVICGSEGTLAIIVGALLKLTPLPKSRGLVVAHFHELLDALAATPAALAHRPAAVELLDHLILDAARENPVMRRRPWHVEGAPRGLLLIELDDNDPRVLQSRLAQVALDLKSRGMGYAWHVVTESSTQDDYWLIRKSGLGLLMSRPGDRQTYDFVEDTAVDPAVLREYIARFMKVLDEEGVPEASYYAHASVGCLHVKPILNLKDAGDIARMHRIAERISSLALEFGGTMTGEHGDGILRSCWLEKMLGPRIVEACRRVKAAFDPRNILNPGKIVDPLPMLENFRYGPQYRTRTPLTVLDFSAHGGMAGLAEMCSGVGQCRQRLVGTMCPSYMATGDERHTTRARANALRLALSNRQLLSGLGDPALDEVMDLCLACKACKAECPTGVDMAKLKAEWLHARHKRHGVPMRARLISHAATLCGWASRAPGLVNALGRSPMLRWLADRALGIDRRLPPPRLARRTFRDWLTRRAPRIVSDPPRGQVAYFVDTWTNYFAPDVGIAAVRVLETLGYEVLVPPVACCGRPAVSQGMLDHARRLAETNAAALGPIAQRGIPIVGTEPSCISALMDELPQLVRTPDAKRIAERAMMIESFLAQHLSVHSGDRPVAPEFNRRRSSILYHAHCHQKALVGTDDAAKVMRHFFGDAAREVASGCCGMAGAFGHEKEHYDVARAVGEERLFPAIHADPDATLLVSGFSCREQIAHHTGRAPRHMIERIADIAAEGS